VIPAHIIHVPGSDSRGVSRSLVQANLARFFTSAVAKLWYCIKTNKVASRLLHWRRPRSLLQISGSSRYAKRVSGSSRARALNETGVGTTWRVSTFRPLCLGNGSRITIEPKLLVITNRKSHMHFRFVSKSLTLDDLEVWTVVQSITLYTYSMLEPTT